MSKYRWDSGSLQWNEQEQVIEAVLEVVPIFFCMPNEPQYKVTTKPTAFSEISPVDYQSPLFNADLGTNDVPCAVCLATKRAVQLMIPARTECPGSEWTLEYTGYLMTSQQSDTNNIVYECIDENAVAIPNTKTCSCVKQNTALFHVISRVGRSDLPSPPYTDQPITCVVCTR